MKKAIGKMLLITVVFIMFEACSLTSNMKSDQPRHVSIQGVIEKIKKELEIENMEVVKENLISEKYHLNMDDVEDVRIESGTTNSKIETIAIVKAKDNRIDSVKEAFEKVVEDKRASAYYKGESEAVDEAEIRVAGKYVGLLIIPDYEEGTENKAEKAVEIFEKSLR